MCLGAGNPLDRRGEVVHRGERHWSRGEEGREVDRRDWRDDEEFESSVDRSVDRQGTQTLQEGVYRGPRGKRRVSGSEVTVRKVLTVRYFRIGGCER